MRIGQQAFHYFNPLKKTVPAAQADSSQAKSPHFGALVKYDIAEDSFKAQELTASFKKDTSVQWVESLPLPHLNNAEVVVAFDRADFRNDPYYKRYVNNIVNKLEDFKQLTQVKDILEKIKNTQPLS